MIQRLLVAAILITSLLLIYIVYPHEIDEATCRLRGYDFCPVCGSCVELDDGPCPACGATVTERLAALAMKHVVTQQEDGVVILPPTLETMDPVDFSTNASWVLISARCHPGPSIRCDVRSSRPDCREGRVHSFGCIPLSKQIARAWAPRECLDVHERLLRSLGPGEMAFHGVDAKRVMLFCS